MLRTKIFASTLLTLVILAAQISPALAAPAKADPTPTPTPPAPITGTIQSITLQTDSAGVTTVAVVLTDGTTVNLSLDTAFNLGLVSTNDPATAVVNDSMIGQTITIDPTDVITPPVDDKGQNPVGAALAAFFDIDYQTLDDYHKDGVGYGVIAQSCWLSFTLAGDASLCGAIIDAKKSGDYSAFPLPDGTFATNWGQFKQSIMDKHNPLQTLGAIMSKHAQKVDDTGNAPTDENSPDTNNGNGNGHGGDGGNGNGHGHGGDGGNGHGHGHGKP